jgi:TRAP-type C4-dicarboxylate transport system substrate-binding protein
LVTVKPVKNLEEFKGILVGAISPVTASMAKDLGGSPVTIMWTDMYESLQKKVVDGTVFNIHAAKVMSLFDVCKYATISFGPASFQGLSINLAIWKKMPESIKKILQEEADASNQWLGEMFAKMVQDEIKELGTKGVSFYMLPPAERARWVDATAANRDKQLAGFGEFGEKIRKSAEAANQLHPYTE